ncbi:hypothetical protein [Paenibacillus cremeus]|uniref:Ferric oxidoreductase domain-containing protein n=1 Tax=Paenibacillus cremeus TaxID=2163881 RepID=A0A559KI43_9BACL|nr:hypothetical protein [Paenibacillus cremeus]TVY11804.1 hypothetical protein FPZ49_00475 [Paenibacillus cremeus]
MEQVKSIGRSEKSKSRGIPKGELGWIAIALIIAAAIVIAGLWSMLHFDPALLHTRRFEPVFKNYGSNARLALFFVLANYVLAKVLQKRLIDPWEPVKKVVVACLRFARKWHTPMAVIAIGLIIVHVVGAFMYGFKFDFHNLSGLIALLALLPVPVAGLFRYRRMDRKWHLRLGLIFTVFFLLHAFI